MNGGQRPVTLQGYDDADIEQDRDAHFGPPQHVIRGHGLVVLDGPLYWAIGLAVVTASALFTAKDLVAGTTQHLVGLVACDSFGRCIPEHYPLLLAPQDKDPIFD